MDLQFSAYLDDLVVAFTIISVAGGVAYRLYGSILVHHVPASRNDRL